MHEVEQEGGLLEGVGAMGDDHPGRVRHLAPGGGHLFADAAQVTQVELIRALASQIAHHQVDACVGRDPGHQVVPRVGSHHGAVLNAGRDRPPGRDDHDGALR